MEVQALLGDLETHSLNCSTCKIRFLQPWAHQGLTPRQWQDLELLIHHYLFNFNQAAAYVPCTPARAAHNPAAVWCSNILIALDFASLFPVSLFLPLPPVTSAWLIPVPSALPVPDPFVTQSSIGCQLHPNGTSRGFYDAAVDGEGFISFDMEAGTWVARQRDKLALDIQDRLNKDRFTAITIQFLLNTTCVTVIKSFVQYGRESLERQERPVAVVFARASPPAGTPAPLLLVCRVTGFHPRPIHVAWLQDGEEVEPGWRLNSTGTLPNADLTYQQRSSLAVQPGDGHSYACLVDHCSLGGQSLLIPW
ncbi:antigen-presenting glycoprotein CD1d-like, partial [Emydura macquarii macquarii]|uniref:antigen-presenting glycoprotein CD1d-like n=1 Tax=Emydura macquarii macquarii TaxID=1129001 RepID=UPI00352B9F0A